MSQTGGFFIIDGYALIYRAFHAIPDLTTSTGIPTNALFGFLRLLARLREEFKPDFLTIAFDAKGPTFRHELEPDYKANRPPMPATMPAQIAAIKDFLNLCKIPYLEFPGFEADDIIASLVAKYQGDCPIRIVSNDKDLQQLVTKDVNCLILNKGISSFAWRDPARVQEKFGVGPAQLLDFLALTGDSSDNIKGLAGVGPKTASSLLNRYQDLDTIYAHLEELGTAKKIEKFSAGKAVVYRARELITLKNDLPVPANLSFFSCQNPTPEPLKDFLQRFELRSLLPHWVVETKVATVNSPELFPVVKQLPDLPLIGRATLPSLLFCYQDNNSWWVSDGQRQTKIGKPHDDAGWQRFWKAKNKTLVGWDLKDLWKQSHQHGTGPLLYDLKIASYLANPTYGNFSFLRAAGHLLQQQLTQPEGPADWLRILQDIYQFFIENPPPVELWEMEQRLVPILGEMEENGIRVDIIALQKLKKAYSSRLAELEQNVIALAGTPLNLNSPQQIADLLFTKLQLKPGRKTGKKTRYSTDVAVLEQLRDKHPVVPLILEHRLAAKLLSTYIEGLLTAADQHGRIFTTLNQTTTTTGRLSSSNPNLQNIPVRTNAGLEIRQVFIPTASGNVLVAADYSQIELRILAHMAQEPALIEAFQEGKDIHSATAAQLFSIPLSNVTANQRRMAKVVNFGIIYGMSSFGLAKDLGISRKEAAQFIDDYFLRYPNIRGFLDQILEEANVSGFVQTLTGRRRYFPELREGNGMQRQFARRAAINMPIQGTAADVIKLAMVKIQPRLPDFNAKMLLQVHDELIFELPFSHQQELIEALPELMENVIALSVPLKINITQGNNWCELCKKK